MDSCVEGMINWDSSCIPERYIRSNEDIYINEDSIFIETPVLDFELLSVSCTQELQKLDMACLDWGFFQVVNHGLTEEMIQKMNKVGDEFFKLPMKEKMKYWTDPITKQGYGQPVPPTQEQKLNWFEPLLLVVHPSEFIKEELWPTTPPQFKEIVEEYSNEIRSVSKVLLGSLSMMMGMEQNALLQLHKEMTQVLGFNYYPICSKPNLVLGLNPHSDISTITILMQDSDVPGLQIRHNGAWIPIKPVPNALMVVIGDTIEMWSNGKYKSVEHRAVTHEYRERLSYATFINPHKDAEIEPLEHMLDAKQPLKMYKKVTYGDYFMHSLKRRHESKEQAEFFKNKF